MARRGENIHKRKDGRWEGRYIKARTPDRRICWGYVYGTTYAEVKQRLIHKKSEYGGFQLIDAHLTFTELAEAWLQSVKCGLKESTYSLDASPGMEHHFPEQAVSPEDILVEKETEREQEAAHALMMERLREALATLTPRQASCLHARFWKGKPFKEIAEAEGFTTSAAIVTVRNAIIKLQKYYIKRGWMKPPKEKAICTKTTPPKRNRKKTSAKKS